MTPRPSKLVYNDLNGEEIKHVVRSEVSARLDEIPYLQRHLTLPRVRVEVSIRFLAYADQPTPEASGMTFSMDVENGPAPDVPQEIDMEVHSAVDSSPKPGISKPPDQIREEFGLPVQRPVMLRDGAGRALAMVDMPTVDGRVVDNVEAGLRFDRTGNSNIMQGGTVVTLDNGPAGLAKGEMARGKFTYGNAHAGSAGKPASPDFRNVKKGVDPNE